MNEDYIDRSDLFADMRKNARTGHIGSRIGRIFDGCIYVTSREWEAVYSPSKERLHSEKDLVEKLQTLPIRVVNDGDVDLLEDGRMLVTMNGVIYLVTEGAEKHPALPRLHIDGKYI